MEIELFTPLSHRSWPATSPPARRRPSRGSPPSASSLPTSSAPAPPSSWPPWEWWKPTPSLESASSLPRQPGSAWQPCPFPPGPPSFCQPASSPPSSGESSPVGPRLPRRGRGGQGWPGTWSGRRHSSWPTTSSWPTSSCTRSRPCSTRTGKLIISPKFTFFPSSQDKYHWMIFR